jgi:hypothetical protein
VDTYSCDDGTVVTEICEVRAEIIEEEPDPTVVASVPIAIPKGTPVTVAEAPHLAYVWDGKWAVPEIQEMADIAALRQHRSRFLIWNGVAIAVIALLLGLRSLYQYRKRPML